MLPFGLWEAQIDASLWVGGVWWLFLVCFLIGWWIFLLRGRIYLSELCSQRGKKSETFLKPKEKHNLLNFGQEKQTEELPRQLAESLGWHH